jgi:hypothetical protein
LTSRIRVAQPDRLELTIGRTTMPDVIPIQLSPPYDFAVPFDGFEYAAWVEISVSLKILLGVHAHSSKWGM